MQKLKGTFVKSNDYKRRLKREKKLSTVDLPPAILLAVRL